MAKMFIFTTLALCQVVVQAAPVIPPVQGSSKDLASGPPAPAGIFDMKPGHQIFTAHFLPANVGDAKTATKGNPPSLSGATHMHSSAKHQLPDLGQLSLKGPVNAPFSNNQKGSISNSATPSSSKPLGKSHKVLKIQENSKNAINSSLASSNGAHMNTAAGAEKLQFRQTSVDTSLDSSETKFVITAEESDKLAEGEKPPSLQLAVKSSLKDNQNTGVKDSAMFVTLGASLVVMFSLGIVVGLFCCCQKKSRSDENENAEKLEEKALMEKSAQESMPLEETKKPSEVFNASDIPSGDKDLDDPVSVKDKIKALDNMLIIGPSPDHVAKRHSQLQPSPKPANRTSQLEPAAASTPDKRWSQLEASPGSKRKSQHEMNLFENKVFSNKVSKNKAEEEEKEEKEEKEEEEPVKTKETKSKSLADNISKSDTQDDISDKIFDNLSTHSNLSQPHNPDVVVASDDENEDEFANLQRGTVILKSFQRAKPPRNRSPATRTSKGRIRKSRQNLMDDTSMSKSLTLSTSQDLSGGVKGQLSTPSTTSLPLVSDTRSSQQDGLDREPASAGPIKDKSIEDLRQQNGVGRRKGSPDIVKKPKAECLMTKSCDFADFDSVMNHSVTSVSSDIGVMPRKLKKDNGSPKQDRTESPARATKTDKRSESPSRYKKSTDSPVGRRKHRRRERERVSESSNGRAAEVTGTDIVEDSEVMETSVTNRLSGLPAKAANNIFYLIDPTVKNKCKSVGDMAADKRRSGDYSKGHSKASKHKVQDEKGPEEKTEKQDESVSPIKRERTQSDPFRRSSTDEPTKV